MLSLRLSRCRPAVSVYEVQLTPDDCVQGRDGYVQEGNGSAQSGSCSGTIGGSIGDRVVVMGQQEQQQLSYFPIASPSRFLTAVLCQCQYSVFSLLYCTVSLEQTPYFQEWQGEESEAMTTACLQELEVQRSELTGNADVELRAKDAEMRRQQAEASAELQVLPVVRCACITVQFSANALYRCAHICLTLQLNCIIRIAGSQSPVEQTPNRA